MKLAVRIFALSVVLAGVAAASVSSSNSQTIASHQAASSALPAPVCGPHIPSCPTKPAGGDLR